MGDRDPLVAPHDFALVGVVDGGDLELFLRDVHPDVELGPVGDGEDADVLARVDAGVVEVPQFGALVLGVPLAVGVAEAEDALLGPGLLLVAARPAEQRVELELRDGVQQRGDLHPVAGIVLSGLLHDAPRSQGVLHRADDQRFPELGGALVAERDDFGEVVPGVHVHQGEGEPSGTERLFRQAQHHDAVLASGKEEGGPLEGARDLAEDVHALRFQGVQVLQVVLDGSVFGGAAHGILAPGPVRGRRGGALVGGCGGHQISVWIPHSDLPRPFQRPERSPSSASARSVSGRSPMLGYPWSCSGL